MVTINDDLSFTPEVAAALDQGIPDRAGGGPRLNPRMIRKALITLLAVTAAGLALFLFDHINTREPDIESAESMGLRDVVMFSSPRVGIVVVDGVLFSGPGRDFAPLAQLRPETRVQVLGVIHREADDSWLVIELFGEQLTGWVIGRVVEF